MKVVTGAEMREIDRRATAEFGIPSLLLMEAAALRVVAATEAMARAVGARRIAVVAGKGSNGGDGLAAVRHLHGRGWDVVLWVVADSAAVQGDARVNLDIARRIGVPFHDSLDPSAELVIDALLGTGIRGAPRDAVAAAISAMNAHPAPILAIDLPSGLDADKGAVPGACVRATRTLTLGLPKPGLLIYPGRANVGALEVAEIGLPAALRDDDALPGHWMTEHSVAALLPARPVDGHKGTFGRVFLLAGSPGLTGAAALASEAALRSGAGLVTLGIPASLNPILEAKLTEVMTLPLAETETSCHSDASWNQIADRVVQSDAVVIGPGLGTRPETGALVRRVLQEREGPLVIDADALNLIAPLGAARLPESAVLTPHPGEMARLLGTTTAEVQSNRLEAARRAATAWGCTVLLKGAGSIVAAPDGRYWICSISTPALAAGGTGDVLSGVIGGLMAQGLPPRDAAIAGVYLHGRAGERLAESVGMAGALAGELLPLLPRVMAELRGVHG